MIKYQLMHTTVFVFDSNGERFKMCTCQINEDALRDDGRVSRVALDNPCWGLEKSYHNQ